MASKIEELLARNAELELENYELRKQLEVCEGMMLKANPRVGIPVCSCGGPGCLSLDEARKKYPLPWRV